MMSLRIFSVFLLASIASTACGPLSDQQHGSLELTTSSATAEKGFSTGDGWSVKLTHLFVDVSTVTVAGLDGVVTASATSQIIDQVPAGAKSLLSATERVARPWEDVSLEIAPAAIVDDVGPSFVEPVTQADVDAMVKGGLSISVVGAATKGAVTKSFRWDFTTDTIYNACAGELNGQSVPGLVVPRDGIDTADIAMDGSVFLSDSLGSGASTLRFGPFAAADADQDNVVTLDELQAVTLESLKTAKIGNYVTPEASTIVDLRGFTEELTRRLVSSFRAKGSCKSAAAPPAP